MQADIWAPLAEGCRPQKWAAGQMIYLQDTEANQFYYILSGTVKCFISSPEGDERTLTLHHSGELIGEAAFSTASSGCPPPWRSPPASWWR